jgi:hypothetical protein
MEAAHAMSITLVPTVKECVLTFVTQGALLAALCQIQQQQHLFVRASQTGTHQIVTYHVCAFRTAPHLVMMVQLEMDRVPVRTTSSVSFVIHVQPICILLVNALLAAKIT